MTATKHGVTASYNAKTEVITVTGTETNGSAFALLISGNTFQLPNFVAGETYTISRAQVTGDFDDKIYVQISYRRTSGINQSLVLNNRTSTTFTVPSDFDCAYNVFVGVFASASDVNYAFKLQLESGSTATAWEPYENICPITGWTAAQIVVSPTTDAADGQTYSITLPSEAGTVYGGTLDVSTGELVVDRAMPSLAGATLYRDNGTHKIWMVPNLPISVNSYGGRATCNITKDFGNVLSTGKETKIQFPFGIHVSMFASTPADFNIADVQACYELATPQTYTLTPTEIRTLLGQNNIWADAGDTSVTYKADTKLYIDKKFTELQALILEN